MTIYFVGWKNIYRFENTFVSKRQNFYNIAN